MVESSRSLFFLPPRRAAHRINVGPVDPCLKGIRLKTAFRRLRSAPSLATSIWLVLNETSWIYRKNFPSNSLSLSFLWSPFHVSFFSIPRFFPKLQLHPQPGKNSLVPPLKSDPPYFLETIASLYYHVGAASLFWALQLIF